MLVAVTITNLLRYTPSREERVETVGFLAYATYFQSVWSLTDARLVQAKYSELGKRNSFASLP